MPDRIDGIIARIEELEKKVSEALGEGSDIQEEIADPRLTIMDVDNRLKAAVPKIVADEVESALAKNETLTRAIMESILQERSASDPAAEPTTIKRKPASSRKKKTATKEEG